MQAALLWFHFIYANMKMFTHSKNVSVNSPKGDAFIGHFLRFILCMLVCVCVCVSKHVRRWEKKCHTSSKSAVNTSLIHSVYQMRMTLGQMCCCSCVDNDGRERQLNTTEYHGCLSLTVDAQESRGPNKGHNEHNGKNIQCYVSLTSNRRQLSRSLTG